MTIVLDRAAKLAWLRLARTPQIGPVTFASLIARFGTAERALEEIPHLAQRGGAKSFVLPPKEDIARELDLLEAIGGRMIASCETAFPPGLTALDPPPPVISLFGQAHLLQQDMVAVVGARNASALARKFAWSLSRDLSEAGLVVASGLARGIDSAAHEAALDAGTVAVVAGGVDIVYPPENESLYRAIAERGVVLSEMRLGEAPQARHFPRRNRLISGLARGVVVVEAAEHSGSLITANYALEQNREVFAVPGSPLDPRSKGANRLIREGAILTEGAEDVLAVLRPIIASGFREPSRDTLTPPAIDFEAEAEADRIRPAIEEALGVTPVEIDELIRQTRASAGAVLTVILELELAGRCRRHPGNRVSWATAPAEA
ncbi:MAG TPA: DNA-processing protein DprA [Rhizomicrobium sp.]|jgi:DNA processing protein|nr:DNA-processing protein DprA [Rhizomicrobium sp.]